MFYLPCIFERTELKESLHFIGTPSAKVTIAVVETYDLCLIIFGFFSLKAIDVVIFSGFAFLPLVLTRVTFRLFFVFDFRPLRCAPTLLQSNDDMKQLSTLPNCPDRLFCCLYCHVLDLLIVMIYDNQSDRERRMIDDDISHPSKHRNIVCAWSCRCSSYFEHTTTTTTTPWQS